MVNCGREFKRGKLRIICFDWGKIDYSPEILRKEQTFSYFLFFFINKIVKLSYFLIFVECRLMRRVINRGGATRWLKLLLVSFFFSSRKSNEQNVRERERESNEHLSNSSPTQVPSREQLQEGKSKFLQIRVLILLFLNRVCCTDLFVCFFLFCS